MIYVVETNRKEQTKTYHVTIHRIDTTKGEVDFPRYIEVEDWTLGQYTDKIYEYVSLDRPKQIIFEKHGIALGLYDTFMQTKHNEIIVGEAGNLYYHQ